MLNINEIKAIIIPLVEQYPIRRVIIFGSYSRGDAMEHSDIDLLIDSEGKLDGFEFFGIVGRIIKRMPVPVDVFEIGEINKPSSFFDNIEREGVVIYES